MTVTEAETGEWRYFLVTLLLTFVGGFADAGSYVLVRSFTGHLTGNSVLFAVHLVNAQWLQATSCLIAVAAFLAGTAGGVSWPHRPGRSACRRLAPVLALEVALVALGVMALSLTSAVQKDVFLTGMCLALGLQNGALGKIESVAFHTTFITGLSTSLVGALAAGKPSPKKRLLPPIILCFIAGALVGAWAVAYFDIVGFALMPGVLACAWLLAITARS